MNYLPGFGPLGKKSSSTVGGVEAPGVYTDSNKVIEQQKTGKSVTGPQIFVHPGLAYLATPQLPDRSHYLYPELRCLRQDPTVALVRAIHVSAIQEAGWSYESTDEAPDGAEELIKKCFEPLRMRFCKQAMEGYIDYGWQTWEVVMTTNDEGEDIIGELKPLLQEITILLVDRRTGMLIGLLQRMLNAAMAEIPVSMVDGMLTAGIVLYRDEMVHTAIDVEGTYWYGRPLLENLIVVGKSYKTIEESAHRYDKKIAGAHWIVHYPIGTSKYNGVDTDNAIIAQNILNNLESNGSAVVPRSIVPYQDDLKVGAEDAWKFELMTADSSSAAQFVDRMKYLDTLKVRAFGTPERSMLEGQYGTKAEAGEHQDLGLVVLEARHALICNSLNNDAVNRVLADNFGDEARDTVKIKPTPLSDDAIAFLRQVYEALLISPAANVEWGAMDKSALRERVGVPFDKDTAADLEDKFADQNEAQMDQATKTAQQSPQEIMQQKMAMHPAFGGQPGQQQNGKQPGGRGGFPLGKAKAPFGKPQAPGGESAPAGAPPWAKGQ